MRTNQWVNLVLVLLLFFNGNVYAAPRIAILDFELNDLTLLPNTPAELTRTASIKPLLEQALKATGDVEIIAVNAQEQKTANAGVEYLFEHNDSSADLGRQFGADWIVVGKHRKPSFLYSHLMVHVINVKTGQIAGNLMVELKGTHEKVTKKSVNSLAKQIYELVNKFKEAM